MTVALIEAREDLFENWADDAKAALIGLPSIPTPGTSPIARLVFRRVWAPERAQLTAAYLAFDGWITPNMDAESTAELNALHQAYMHGGSFGWITVVGATTFVRAQDWPTDEIERAAAQGRELDSCLSYLNSFLLALGLARNDPSIAPVARGDLPRLCPVILETAPMESARNAVSYPYQIHGINPHKHATTRTFQEMDDSERLAVDLARDVYFTDEPWFLYYELMQQAVAGYDEHRDRAPVLALGTAIEVLFAIAIRQAALAHGETEEAIAAILDYPLRNQIEHHLPRYVNCVVSTTDTTNAFGRWWQGGYELRNKVVHDGYRPTRTEIKAALEDAMALADVLSAGLASDPTTVHLSHWIGRGLEDGSS
jgi:hypothetical protein